VEKCVAILFLADAVAILCEKVHSRLEFFLHGAVTGICEQAEEPTLVSGIKPRGDPASDAGGRLTVGFIARSTLEKLDAVIEFVQRKIDVASLPLQVAQLQGCIAAPLGRIWGHLEAKLCQPDCLGIVLQLSAEESQIDV